MTAKEKIRRIAAVKTADAINAIEGAPVSEYAEVYLCLDNDEAGHKATERLAARLGELGGQSVHRLCPKLEYACASSL